MVDATAEAFRAVVLREFAVVSGRGDSHVCIRAGDLHRKLGGYPFIGHRMPVCCSVMRSLMLQGDVLVKTPANGAGAKLTIEYRLPRP